MPVRNFILKARSSLNFALFFILHGGFCCWTVFPQTLVYARAPIGRFFIPRYSPKLVQLSKHENSNFDPWKISFLPSLPRVSIFFTATNIVHSVFSPSPPTLPCDQHLMYVYRSKGIILIEMHFHDEGKPRISGNEYLLNNPCEPSNPYIGELARGALR